MKFSGERLFDAEGFGRRIRVRMAERNIDQRTAATEASVSTSTICRAAQGRGISVENYLRICRWLDGAPP